MEENYQSNSEPKTPLCRPPLIKRKIVNYTWVPKSIAVIAEIKGILLKTGTNYWV